MAHKKIKDSKKRARFRRKGAIRKKISGTSERPRLSVFRSLKHIYVQAIDDTTNTVLASASDAGKSAAAMGDVKKAERAEKVGQAIGEALVAKQISSVVFDRNGFIYHGRVKALAEGARKAGLVF
jgi:large subunit ribosomal protein L18